MLALWIEPAIGKPERTFVGKLLAAVSPGNVVNNLTKCYTMPAIHITSPAATVQRSPRGK